jgi:hypothetical protein
MLIVPGARAAEKDSYDNLASNVRRKSATRRRRGMVLSFRKGCINLPEFVDNPRSACGVCSPNLEFRDGNDRSIEGIA